ncbi:MAG: argininosuccinate synthase [Thermodesulfobacteriota bacterium]|nr:argininosuccinate synthase [Thermodesulfobacteriota bacterium]
MQKALKKIVVAYSGGLDTSVIITWLKEKYQCEIIAFTANIGQEEELEGLEKKALQTGATKFFVEDMREEFVRDYVFPMLRANAVYEGGYLLGTSIARPIIAKKQVEIAKREGADGLCHGATGKGNDQVRFELTYMVLAPELTIISAWRDDNWKFSSRASMIEYATLHNIPVKSTKDKPYSVDKNLFHISYEGGILEDPFKEPDEEMFHFTVSPEEAPDSPTYIEIDYEYGNPVGLNGEKMSPALLLSTLNRIAGENGIGRADIVENRYVGMKSRGVYETPGGTVLHTAHQAVESITMDREVLHLRDSLISRYSELIYYGYWFSPERFMLQSAIDDSQKNVTGTARLKLYKGNCMVVGRKSERSLYRSEIATFEEDLVYNQKDAEGFIRLCGLRLKTSNISEFNR